jgi:hypothetical protein
MRFSVDREIDSHWYSIDTAVEAGSAGQAVALCATSEGTYRATPLDEPATRAQVFSVPAWGPPDPIKP